jgi:hyperosmotically inducible periplasmic protein
MFRTSLSAALLLMALGAPAWAADPAPREPAAQTLSKDATLQLFKDVQKQVLGYPQFSIFDSVHIALDNGNVELTGKVTMPYKRDEIEKRVAKVAGVRSVTNRIDTLPASQFDDQLRFRIARAIYSNANFWGYGSMVNPPIHVIVEHGRVTLEGVVNNNVDRMIARSIASSFTSFGPVTNALKTEAEAKEELERL